MLISKKVILPQMFNSHNAFKIDAVKLNFNCSMPHHLVYTDDVLVLPIKLRTMF